jgi:hypothetical protein
MLCKNQKLIHIDNNERMLKRQNKIYEDRIDELQKKIFNLQDELM